MAFYMAKENTHGMMALKFKWIFKITSFQAKESNKITTRINFPDGSYYEGDILNGLRHGFGTFTSEIYTYKGNHSHKP